MIATEERVGLYVHIPFCEAKCTYCHFAIDPRRPDEARQERYARALLAEMAGDGTAPAGDGKRARSRAREGRADTLYFGGGTPSLLASDRLATLIEGARSRFALDPKAEVTLEANPRDLGAEGYRAVRGAGVNRLSLGVQAFDAAALGEMGRLHSAGDAAEAVAMARRAGFDNISVDLILGWPGETRERWATSLAGLAALQPDHVSLYVLEVEGKTLLSHRAQRGQLALPDDDLVADLYRETVDALGTLGIERYEISNFARPGFESRHNCKYWDDSPFLGFGMSAHSYDDGCRSWNVATYAGYCRAVEAGGAAAARAGHRLLTERERRGEALFTGLRRREGIDVRAFRRRYDVDPLREYGEQLRDPFAAGLLAVDGDRLHLTERGILLSNEVFRAFV